MNWISYNVCKHLDGHSTWSAGHWSQCTNNARIFGKYPGLRRTGSVKVRGPTGQGRGVKQTVGSDRRAKRAATRDGEAEG